MSTKEDRHVWLGFASCGHGVFCSYEEFGGPSEQLFKDLARLRKEGRRVERMPLAEAKPHIGAMGLCECPKTPAELVLEKKYEAQRKRDKARFKR